MKKFKWIAGALIVLLAILCFALWQQKEAEHAKMERLCQGSAAMALEAFAAYQTSGEESDYLRGVSDFRSFMTAYLYLQDNVGDAEYTWCNIVYGEMILNPEKVRSNTQGLIDALGYLAEDYDDPNGFVQINTYSNELIHAED